MLSIFNRLTNNAKEESIVQNFIKELNDFLKQDKQNRKEKSEIQILQEQNKITTSCRDMMHSKRSQILLDYAKQTKEKGTMYYIYNKDKSEKGTYHLCICDDKNSRKVIKVNEKELPEGAGVETVLRMANDKYTIDTETTDKLRKSMEAMIENTLKEQNETIEKNRINEHIYEVVEISKKEITLLDITNDRDNGECFEELVLNQNLQDIKEGDILKYKNGEYVNIMKK